jgi:spermidine synthase
MAIATRAERARPSQAAAAEAPDIKRFSELRSKPLLALFGLSGCAALIYELVWFQWLELVIGSSAISLGILLAVYMGGMCAGSLLAPRLLRGSLSPLRAYAWLELAIAASAALLWLAHPAVRAIYASSALPGSWNLVLRAVIAGACLLPPTILMGASLPIAARMVSGSREGMEWLGQLYALNALGAFVGCVLAGFYLLRVHDMTYATWAAILLNVFAAATSYLLSGGPAPRAVTTNPGGVARRPWIGGMASVHAVVLLSGFCALGGEVVWTRMLALLLGATVYTFTIILAVVLVGIGAGGAAGALLVRLSPSARRNLGIVQLLLVPACLWASYLVNVSLPYWPITPGLSPGPWTTFQLDLLRCLWALFPAAVLWGATIPLALATTRPSTVPADRFTASIYAANTLGAILGALVFTFALTPLGGTRVAQQAMLWASLAAAAFGFWPLLRRPFASRRALAYGLVLLVGATGTFVAVGNVPGVPGELIAFGRSLAYRRGLQDPRTGQRVPLPRLMYVGEGLSESVAVTTDERVRLFHVSGKIEASTAPKDMRLQRMLGGIPALAHPAPRSVLVVGFGAGVTAGTFLRYPSVERVVICELEPLIPQRVAGYFADVNNAVATDPRVHIVYDDARHFMLTNRDHFDIITSDPIHPWVKGSAALYSREYFELVRRRLNPGGLVTQWVPLYQSSEATIKGELATFMTAFPGATVWANRDQGQGYDLVLMGTTGAASLDLDALERRWHAADYAAAQQQLADVGFPGWADLMATYAGRNADLRPWLAGAAINEDRSLHLQYQAGLESLLEQEGDIYASMSRYRSFPADLFVGSPQNVEAVRAKGAE